MSKYVKIDDILGLKKGLQSEGGVACCLCAVSHISFFMCYGFVHFWLKHLSPTRVPKFKGTTW